MASQRIKKGDKVIILSGKDKGKTGEVTMSMPKTDKVVVSGVNIAVRHTKPTQGDPQGGLVRKEAPMHVSKEEQDGKKVRVAVKTGEKING
jgi:large subunit ribosomal protein L24